MWWTHERRGHAANDSLETSIARQAGSQKARSPFKDSIPQLTLIVAVRIAWIFISDNNCLLPRHILALLPTTGTRSRQHRLSTGSAPAQLPEESPHSGATLKHTAAPRHHETSAAPEWDANNPSLLSSSRFFFLPPLPLKRIFHPKI